MLRFSTLGPWVVESPAGSSKFWQQAEEQEAGLQEDQGFYLDWRVSKRLKDCAHKAEKRQDSSYENLTFSLEPLLDSLLRNCCSGMAGNLHQASGWEMDGGEKSEETAKTK